MSRTSHGRRGFTLVELLVVIGIIALLVGVLIPVLNKAKERANAIKCQANLRTLMQGFHMFAADNKDHFPGNDGDRGNPDEKRRCFLSGPPKRANGTDDTTGTLMGDAPTRGTIFKYVRQKDVYRCPSQPADSRGAMGGSNFAFDYAVFKGWTGVKRNKVPNTARFRDPINGRISIVPTPVIVQEHAFFFNGSYQEGGHSNRDAMERIHNKGSYYASIDGSVQFFSEPAVDYNNDAHGLAKHWEAIAPSKKWVSFGLPGATWGWWHNQ
jgi:prepilin-type N-terminal cleavage/methylation domain-containing protein